MSNEGQIESQNYDLQPLDLVYYQLRRAIWEYSESGSPFARDRARELLAVMRAGLDSVDQLLAQGEPIRRMKALEEGHRG